MAESVELLTVLHGAISVAWVLLDLVIAGIVVYRFRATPTTYLVAGGFGAFALLRIVSSVFYRLLLPLVSHGAGGWSLAFSVLSTLVYVLVCIVVAVGVGLVPASLRRLAERAGP